MISVFLVLMVLLCSKLLFESGMLSSDVLGPAGRCRRW